MRQPVVYDVVRQGETLNLIHQPKGGKSWLVGGLALTVATGGCWLERFDCTQGRVLMIDAELYPEVIAYRLPMIADAMSIDRSALEYIDVWPLRGSLPDLFKLAPSLNAIEPGKYALIVLDAWYRFLPPGISENDNAAVMSLYNTIDGYASRLGAAWINVHHASKGDQTGKGVTDVGSGAGAQSRAADTHVIIRPHAQDNVAVMEAVVRSFPPIDPVSIRFDFPIWSLAHDADPRDLRKPRERSVREDRDRHLDADRRSIVNAMVKLNVPETKTVIRDLARVGPPRFGFAWESLLADKTIVPTERITKGNGRTYEGFAIAVESSETATGEQRESNGRKNSPVAEQQEREKPL
ncbi:MAG: AAA family ATPase [Candidatus Anammoximicrobium sp.]|nr:AAA family ATPase [Candidatus Anammoximicrobium sp.]